MSIEMSNQIKRLVLIGVGLIGGSFVLDLKRLKLVETVVGIDLNAENLERALERRVIDQSFTSINPQAIGQGDDVADLIVIATPVSTLPNICEQIASVLELELGSGLGSDNLAQTKFPKRPIIMDVGSTKQTAIHSFQKYFSAEQFAHCVAAHPIAGSDRSGALAAQFGLYQNKRLILCPHEKQFSGSLKTVEQLWKAIGANVSQMSAQEHDQIFAMVSHFPHLLAFSYVHQIFDNPNGLHQLQFAGSGFRDFTRIAGSSPEMWKDVFFDNRQTLLELIEQQKTQLQFIQNCLENQDKQTLFQYLSEAKNIRENWEH